MGKNNKKDILTLKEFNEKKESLKKQPFKSFFNNNYKPDQSQKEIDTLKKRVKLLEDKLKAKK